MSWELAAVDLAVFQRLRSGVGLCSGWLYVRSGVNWGVGVTERCDTVIA